MRYYLYIASSFLVLATHLPAFASETPSETSSHLGKRQRADSRETAPTEESSHALVGVSSTPYSTQKPAQTSLNYQTVGNNMRLLKPIRFSSREDALSHYQFHKTQLAQIAVDDPSVVFSNLVRVPANKLACGEIQREANELAFSTIQREANDEPALKPTYEMLGSNLILCSKLIQRLEGFRNEELQKHQIHQNGLYLQWLESAIKLANEQFWSDQKTLARLFDNFNGLATYTLGAAKFETAAVHVEDYNLRQTLKLENISSLPMARDFPFDLTQVNPPYMLLQHCIADLQNYYRIKEKGWQFSNKATSTKQKRRDKKTCQRISDLVKQYQQMQVQPYTPTYGQTLGQTFSAHPATPNLFSGSVSAPAMSIATPPSWQQAMHAPYAAYAPYGSQHPNTMPTAHPPVVVPQRTGMNTYTQTDTTNLTAATHSAPPQNLLAIGNRSNKKTTDNPLQGLSQIQLLEQFGLERTALAAVPTEDPTVVPSSLVDFPSYKLVMPAERHNYTDEHLKVAHDILCSNLILRNKLIERLKAIEAAETPSQQNKNFFVWIDRQLTVLREQQDGEAKTLNSLRNEGSLREKVFKNSSFLETHAYFQDEAIRNALQLRKHKPFGNLENIDLPASMMHYWITDLENYCEVQAKVSSYRNKDSQYQKTSEAKRNISAAQALIDACKSRLHDIVPPATAPVMWPFPPTEPTPFVPSSDTTQTPDQTRAQEITDFWQSLLTPQAQPSEAPTTAVPTVPTTDAEIEKIWQQWAYVDPEDPNQQ